MWPSSAARSLTRLLRKWRQSGFGLSFFASLRMTGVASPLLQLRLFASLAVNAVRGHCCACRALEGRRLPSHVVSANTGGCLLAGARGMIGKGTRRHPLPTAEATD